MKGFKRILAFFYGCLAFYTLVVFALIYFLPSSHWLAGFLMMSYPVALILNLLFAVLWLLIKPVKMLVPLGIVIISLIFLPRTFSFKTNRNIWGEKSQPGMFKIMNYNVFGFYPTGDIGLDKTGKRVRTWIAESNADILCMPEYTSYKKLDSQNSNDFFLKKGYKYKSLYKPGKGYYDHAYKGLAIFSKYPIVYSRDTLFHYRNGLILADVKMGKDTLRVIAVHLYSMTLKLKTLINQNEIAGVKREGLTTFKQMKTGFVQRAKELDLLESWIAESPYPVVVCGDFNETPYSYVYGKTRNLLTNAFEEKGSGFGYTYNKLPYFIRIDHQFYDPEGLNLIDFATNQSVRYSDHYPSMATYSFK